MPPPPPPPPRRRGFPILAWLVILGVVGAVVASNMFAPEAPPAEPGTQSMDVFIMNMQSKYIVGAFGLIPEDDGAALSQANTMLNMGSIDQRLGFVILSAEIGNAEDADAHLRDLLDLIAEYKPELTEEQRQLLAVINRIYLLPQDALIESVQGEDGAAARTDEIIELTKDEEDALSQQLGWLGELAITHADPRETVLRDDLMASAMRVAIAFISFLVGVSIVGFGGFVGLAVMFVLVLIGRVPLRFRRVFPDCGIYAETFAVWILLFLGLQIAGAALQTGLPELLVALIAFFLSLFALVWPVVRGIRWADVRTDIGWTSGRGVIVEVGAGLVSYAMTLPLVGLGLLGTLFLMGIAGIMTPADPDASPFAPAGFPAHPIITGTGGSDIWPKVLLLLVASVAAPIVEETMFRGVLYRSLRNASAGWVRFFSVVMSVLFVSVIFAAIHPQGLFAVPVLASLAAGMNLTREWRDSLIASMVVHGTSNGIVMSLLLIVAS